MTFPNDDAAWRSVADFLLGRLDETASIVAPTEFHEIFPRTYPYDVLGHLDLKGIDALVIHKGMLNAVGRDVCSLLAHKGIPLFGNEVFVVYTLKGRRPWRVRGKKDFVDFCHKIKKPEIFPGNPIKQHSEFSGPATVILITTYNRPYRLGISLETISQLRAPILVVNDGSSPEHDAAYAAIYKKFGVRVLNMPDNRGLSNVLNAGLSYWLADPNVEWICYLQDDVEVRTDLLAVLARVQDPKKYPLWTGRLNELYKVYGEKEINGQKVLLQRMCPGIHLHGHRHYWEKLLPIPTAYFQAPRRWPGAPLRGADEDWWIALWSPHSVVKQGGYVAVLPGLVRTTTVFPAESTWGNPGLPDPLLPPAQYVATDFVPATYRDPAAQSVAATKPESESLPNF